jgi:hypothetical protein
MLLKSQNQRILIRCNSQLEQSDSSSSSLTLPLLYYVVPE